MKFETDFDVPEVTKWEACLKTPVLGGPTQWGSSKYDDFMRCPRRYFLAHKKRLTREGVDMALETGGAVHEAMARAYEADYEAAGAGATLEQCDEAFLQAVWDFLGEIQGATCVAETRRLLEGWLKYYGPGAPRDMRVRTIAIEKKAEVKRPFPYSTRIDQAVEDENDSSAYWILDHKTMSRYLKDVVQGYSFHSQFLGQQYCMRHDKKARKGMGKLKGTVVDVIVKTNPAQFYQHTIAYDAPTVNRWAKNQHQVYRMLDNCEAYGYWPQLLSNCHRYNKFCRFFDYCRTGGKSMAGLRKKNRNEF